MNGINGTTTVITSFFAWQLYVCKSECDDLVRSGAAARWQAKVEAKRSAKTKPHVSQRAIATKRDNYGAKGL